MTLVLTVDWSADSTAVTITDIAARSIVAEGRSLHRSGTAATETTANWWESLVGATHTAIDGLAALGLTINDIRLIELSGNEPGGGLVAFDSSGIVCAALPGNHVDSGPDADRLIAQFAGGAASWREATGVLPEAGSTVALLSWLRRTAPETWAELHTITVPLGFYTQQLGGDHAISPSAAIGTGVVDRQSGAWCLAMLDVVDSTTSWTAALPRITDAATPVGLLTSDAAHALGLPSGCPLHVGSASST
jgi:sugar (pentulose or hexulose) kinase